MRVLSVVQVRTKKAWHLFICMGYLYQLFYQLVFNNSANHLDFRDITNSRGDDSKERPQQKIEHLTSIYESVISHGCSLNVDVAHLKSSNTSKFRNISSGPVFQVRV